MSAVEPVAECLLCDLDRKGYDQGSPAMILMAYRVADMMHITPEVGTTFDRSCDICTSRIALAPISVKASPKMDAVVCSKCVETHVLHPAATGLQVARLQDRSDW